MILSASIFLITLLFIIILPKNIQIGSSAIIGANISLLLGSVSFNEVLVVSN
ncbi:ArsB/NhaD family transporter, partial [Aliarcobacter lanthieri]|uniref:ArsB/NhaD family transporter n=1 Tax=Aliarcobacter lanthieri TaxID=1355374 RepID=UPI003AA889C6